MAADVDGHRLWFRSRAPLRNSVEAYASAAWPSALLAGRDLELDRPVSAQWLQGARQIGEVAHEWWGWHRVEAHVPAVVMDVGVPRLRAPGVGLCFSGGVDSFHSLLAEQDRVTVLVGALGFDIPLDDRARWRQWRDSLTAIGRATGTRVVTIATNVRTHPFTGLAPWPMSHGGALAALGHLLRDSIGELIVSASYPRVMTEAKWGSHWRLDPHWSSGRLQVRHIGADLWRAEKLAVIADNPVVQRHLRVCWVNTTPDLNCGICEKCIRTQVVLDRLGLLGRFTVFPGNALPDSIDRLPALRNPDLIEVYEGFRADAAPALRAALVRLLARSEGR